MANVKFYPENKGKPTSLIMLRFWYSTQDCFKYSTGERVPAVKWNSKQSRVRSSYTRASIINQYLDKLEQHCKDIKTQMLIDGECINKIQFKRELQLRLGILSDSIAWSEYYPKQSSTKHVISHCNKLTTYFGAITVDQIGKRLLDSLIKKEFENGNSPAYVNKILKSITSIIRHADNNDIKVDSYYKRIKYLNNAKAKDTTFFTDTELRKLYYNDYPEQLTELKRANRFHSRDTIFNSVKIFLIGAFTGLRLSDFKRVAAEPDKYIHSEGSIDYIEIFSDKVTKKAVIPMHPIIRDILKEDLKPVSDQKLRLHIKVAAKAIGLTQPFTRIEYPGNVKTTCTYQRYELVSTHTARRSLITNLYIAGVDINMIQLVSGHSTQQQLMNYIKQTLTDNARLLAEHPYFKEGKHLNIIKSA